MSEGVAIAWCAFTGAGLGQGAISRATHGHDPTVNATRVADAQDGAMLFPAFAGPALVADLTDRIRVAVKGERKRPAYPMRRAMTGTNATTSRDH